MTALIWHMRHINQRGTAALSESLEIDRLRTPDTATARRLLQALDLGVDQLDVLVVKPEFRRPGVSCARCHVLGQAARESGLLLIERVPSPIPELELFVTVPELTLLMASRGSSVLDAIYYGMALCSDYRLDPTRPSGVRARGEGDGPPTTMNRLAHFTERASRVPGAPLVKRALPHIREHARSPRESGFAMLFGLPAHFGGYHLGEITLNPLLTIGVPVNGSIARTDQDRYPDIVITARGRDRIERHIGFDYDADSEHATDSRKHASDTRRRNDLATVDNFPCFALTTLQASDFNEVARVAEQMRRALRQRSTPRIPKGTTSEERDRILDETYRRRLQLWLRYVVRRRKDPDQ